MRGIASWSTPPAVVAFTDRDNRNDCDSAASASAVSASRAAQSLVGTGFYVNPAAAFAGNLVGPTNAASSSTIATTTTSAGPWAAVSSGPSPTTGRPRSKVCTSPSTVSSHNNNGFLGGSVVGVSNTGAAVTAGQLGFDNRRDREDFGVVRVGVNYKFGSGLLKTILNRTQTKGPAPKPGLLLSRAEARAPPRATRKAAVLPPWSVSSSPLFWPQCGLGARPV